MAAETRAVPAMGTVREYDETTHVAISRQELTDMAALLCIADPRKERSWVVEAIRKWLGLIK